MGEFCSFPPITLKPSPSSVFGSSTTLWIYDDDKFGGADDDNDDDDDDNDYDDHFPVPCLSLTN